MAEELTFPGVKMLRRWVTKGLRRGDLHALRDIKQRTESAPNDGQLSRLEQRGYLAVSGHHPRLTAKGRMALMLRRFV